MPFRRIAAIGALALCLPAAAQADWNKPGPKGFTDADAVKVIAAADFTKSYFVQVHKTGNTKSTFAHVFYTDSDKVVWVLTAACHTHKKAPGVYTIPGNCYIPAWANWELKTPDSKAAIIAIEPDGGSISADGGRYPFKAPT